MRHTVIEPLQRLVSTRKDEIMAELARIDADTSKPRTAREMGLGNTATRAWVAAKDAEAAALRAELAAL